MLRLRFDKVAIRVIRQLETNLADAVPGGMAVVVTITAPIRLASKATTAIEEQVQALLNRGTTNRDKKLTVCGNRIGIRFVKHTSRRAPKVIGFVHNPDSNPLTVFRDAGVQELAAASRFSSNRH